ncbi:MAG: putative cytochrome c oxidase subunit [Ilumatobacteraceae bacterium]|nr:putative cytochrome c oxidase subunit [Ilumatobacteraceae bacterium]MCU1387142.1 putative cytochrome c oxidase subunit [Ilumatobacteraceae bacterium]
MTTIDTASHSTSEASTASASHALSTVGAWITTSDHKRLGRMLIGCGLIALLGIGAVGGLLGLERIDVNTTTLGSGSIDQMFSIFRVGLAFFAVLPVMLGLGVAVVPLQLGARALAFPRLAAAGFWAWFFGMALVVLSILANGGPGGGTSKYVALYISAFAVMLGGLTMIAISLATTVLTTRAPGMNMRRVPTFAWSVLVSSLGLVIVLPVVIGASIYLYVSYRYNRIPFGGNEGILDWTGFSMTQPQTFLYVLPAVGFFAELIPVTARKRMPMRGFVLAGLGLVGVAAITGATQLPHLLPWRGSKLYLGHFSTKLGDLISYGLFNIVPVLGVVIVVLLGPLAFAAKKGQRVAPKITAPFIFGFFGVTMLLVGMVASILDGVIDLGLQGTVYEEGTYTYVCYGAILAALGAVTYWGPKLWGRRLADKKVMPLALLGVLAVVLSSLPYLVAGFADQPAGAITFSYGGPHALWNTLTTIGHFLMVLTVLAYVGLALQGFRKGDLAGDDPWDAHTLEWATSSPPPANNFVELHTVMSPQPLLDLKPSPDAPKTETA